MAIVYQHIRLDTNEIFYIGVGATLKRAYSKTCRNSFWKAVTYKTSYKVEILHNDITYEEALLIEISLIESIGRRTLNKGPLVNIDAGGRGSAGHKQSKESIEKRRQKMLGHKVSEETKEKLRISNLGKKRSSETRQANRIANLGKKLSNDHKLKISKGLLNNKNKALYKKGKKVINTETNEIYKSMSMVAKLFNIPKETLRRRLNNSPEKCKPFEYLT